MQSVISESSSSAKGGVTTLFELSRSFSSPRSDARQRTVIKSSSDNDLKSSNRKSAIQSSITLSPVSSSLSLHDSYNGSLFQEKFESIPDCSSIYLSVYFSTFSTSSKRVGIAYFDAETEMIYVSEFIDPDGLALNSMKSRLSPQVIITHVRSDEEFFKVLQRDCDGNEPILYNVQTFRRSEFDYENSLNKLKLLHIREIQDELDEQSFGSQPYLPGTSEIFLEMRLMSIVSFEQRNMICALGGLLSYIQKNNIINQLEEKMLPVSIAAIRQVPSSDLVAVDDTTLRSLTICQSEFHPVGSSSGKEGLSVLKLLDETRTSQGKRLLRAWLLAPTRNLAVIHTRQEAILELLDPKNEHWLAEITLRISSIRDIRRILIRLEKVRANYSDWIHLSESIQHLISLRELAHNDAEHIYVLRIINEIWDEGINELNDLITSVIDFPESKRSKRLDIRHGLCPELDKMKHNYEQLGTYLTSVAQDLVESSDNLRHLEVLQLPQLGHLIAIPLEPGKTLEEQKSVPSFDFQFFAENKLFFKNDRARQLDRDIGDIRGVILDVEASFVRELAHRVLAFKPCLLALSLATAEIDCLLSLAKSAAIYNLTRPTFTPSNLLEIKKGFHLIQAQTLDQFIPNDIYLGRDEIPIMLVTGPNRSGKSVLLKQVGIIVYLAHCGSFVPAESAVIGPVDQIFCRIDLEETVISSLSTFATDCNQTSRMLRHATPSSLLLLDEFGKGTVKEDGIALMASIFHYFYNQGVDRIPRTILTTHFHELFSLKLLPQNPQIPLSFHKMDVIAKVLDKDSSISLDINDRVTFLYKLVPGISLHSYGIDCAAMAGFPETLINRAKHISMAYLDHQPIHRINENSNRFERLYRNFLNLNLDDYDAVKIFMEFLKSA